MSGVSKQVTILTTPGTFFGFRKVKAFDPSVCNRTAHDFCHQTIWDAEIIGILRAARYLFNRNPHG